MDPIAGTDIKRKKRREFSESELKEKLNAFGDIIKKILQLILKISDLADARVQDLTSKLSNLQNQLNRVNKDITTLKAILIKERHIFMTLKRLSKGPIPLIWLREWFNKQFPEKSFDGIIKTLQDWEFIFIPQVRFVEDYVFLFKDTNGEYLQGSLVLKSIEKKIESIMKEKSINELKIARQYIPELFGMDLVEISKDDGLPIFEPIVVSYLLSKGIYANIFGNTIRLTKMRKISKTPKMFRNLEHRKSIDDEFKKVKTSKKAEFKINEYITLKLENNKTLIYIKEKKFMQCIRLALQIPPEESHLYEEIESIDQAAEVYKHYLWENKIGPTIRSQNRTITPEQEFWGHCSNLQTWVEHNYDTRLLRSNLSFPLLKQLANVGDELARKIFKGEIAQRLESGYPSVVQYLIIQGYLYHFTSTELKTIIETTNLIKIVSSELKMLSRFLQAYTKRFPTVLGDILLKILELPKGKENLYTVSSRNTWDLEIPLNSNPQFLEKIKDALKEKLKEVRKDEKRNILDYIQIIDDNVDEKKRQIEAKNFELEKAELNRIVKDLNLKIKKMHEEYDLMLLRSYPISQLQFNKERSRLQVYLYQLIPISRRIHRIGINLKMKLIELEKIKNKREDVSKFINQAKDLISLNYKQQKKMLSLRKDLYSKLMNSV